MTLASLLESFGLNVSTGVQTLRGDLKDATHLIGLPFLAAGDIRPRIDANQLRRFDRHRIHRPRTGTAFKGPLVIVGEGMNGGRPAVGVSKADVVYSESYYGISVSGHRRDLSLRIGGVLLSAVTSWNLLLTASEFGIHKRKLNREDLLNLPVPSSQVLMSADSLPIALAMENLGNASKYDDVLLSELDTAVFDVYGLDAHERLIVLDGLARAKREYRRHKLDADRQTNAAQLRSYATAFLSVINAWLCALDRKPYGAEILGLRSDSPLRVIRFLEGGGPEVRHTEPEYELEEVLARIGTRIRLPIAESLSAVRELRVHGHGELLIIKPAARRYWMPATGLNDADSALGDGLRANAE